MAYAKVTKTVYFELEPDAYDEVLTFQEMVEFEKRQYEEGVIDFEEIASWEGSINGVVSEVSWELAEELPKKLSNVEEEKKELEEQRKSCPLWQEGKDCERCEHKSCGWCSECHYDISSKAFE